MVPGPNCEEKRYQVDLVAERLLIRVVSIYSKTPIRINQWIVGLQEVFFLDRGLDASCTHSSTGDHDPFVKLDW